MHVEEYPMVHPMIVLPICRMIILSYSMISRKSNFVRESCQNTRELQELKHLNSSDEIEELDCICMSQT